MTLWERVVGVFRRLRGAAREGKASLRPGKGVEAGGSELPGGTAEGLELREGGAFPATARGGGSGGGAFPAAAVAPVRLLKAYYLSYFLSTASSSD